MTNQIEPGSPTGDALANWVLANEALLSDLSSIFTVLSNGKLEPGTPAELARQLLSSSISPQALKDFRDYSVRLLSSPEGIISETGGPKIFIEKGSEPFLPSLNPSVAQMKEEFLKRAILDQKEAHASPETPKGDPAKPKMEMSLPANLRPLKGETPLEQKGDTASKAKAEISLAPNIGLPKSEAAGKAKAEISLTPNISLPKSEVAEPKKEILLPTNIRPSKETSNPVGFKEQTPSFQITQNSPLMQKNNPMTQMPRDPGLTIPQAMKKILQEVLNSLNVLSAAPTEEKARALQLKTVHQKISTIMEELVAPVKGGDETDFTSRDSAKNSIKSAVKKTSSKESISIPVFENEPTNKKTLEDRTIQPKNEPILRENSTQPSKGATASQNLSSMVNSNPGPQVRPQVVEQTSISSAPFSPQVTQPNSLRKEKKKRKSPWEREEYEEDEERENK